MFNLDKKEISFLIVSFARPTEAWDLPEEEIVKIKTLNQNKIIHFHTASKENFIKELKVADVVYVRGGNTSKLVAELKKTTDFNDLIQGKVVAGSSAGALALAKYYFSQDEDSISEGLGILPAKMITHFGLPNNYNQSFEPELKTLQEYKKEESLKTIALRETEFVIIEQ
jgi:peptidase E